MQGVKGRGAEMGPNGGPDKESDRDQESQRALRTEVITREGGLKP